MYFKRIKADVGLMIVVPLIMVWIMEPVLIYQEWLLYHDIGGVYGAFVKWNQVIVPIAAVFCPVSLLNEYVTGLGNEILVMRLGNAVYRVLTVVFLYFVGIVLPFYIVFLIVTDMPIGIWSGEIVRAIIVCMFVVGNYYMIALISGSLNVPLTIFSAYCVICLFSENMEASFLNFRKMIYRTPLEMLKEYYVFLVLGIVSFVIAGIINKKKIKFY